MKKSEVNWERIFRIELGKGMPIPSHKPNEALFTKTKIIFSTCFDLYSVHIGKLII